MTVTGGIGVVSPASGVSTTLDAQVPGTGVVQADHATATDEAALKTVRDARADVVTPFPLNAEERTSADGQWFQPASGLSRH